MPRATEVGIPRADKRSLTPRPRGSSRWNRRPRERSGRYQLCPPPRDRASTTLDAARAANAVPCPNLFVPARESQRRISEHAHDAEVDTRAAKYVFAPTVVEPVLAL